MRSVIDGKTFHILAGRGFKANCADTETGEEYWTQIRKQPDNLRVKKFRAMGKCK